MSSSIVFKNVSKRFNYFEEKNRSLKTALVDLFKGKSSSSKKQVVHVLKDVSFEINAGDFVALLGRNGAGKSTALKLISGIYQPTSGSLHVNGKIAPLIELGAGFDPELSGMENIFLNAAIIGFSKAQAEATVDSIVEFSGLGKLIHMPVKGYSSGMLVRLGFSIATHLDAPILLVDEVLAVGDQEFQDKCIEKIKALRSSGKTIIFVSHSLEQVRAFANTGALFSEGRLEKFGPIEDVIKAYEALLGTHRQ